MGYNTQILLFNDGIGAIERSPEVFVHHLSSTIARTSHGDVDHETLSVDGHDVGMVIPTAHADLSRVFVSHGNWLWEVKGTGPTFERALREEYLREELLTRCHLAHSSAALVRERLTLR